MAPTIEPAPTPPEVELVELDARALPVSDAEAEGVKVTRSVVLLVTLGATVEVLGAEVLVAELAELDEEVLEVVLVEEELEEEEEEVVVEELELDEVFDVVLWVAEVAGVMTDAVVDVDVAGADVFVLLVLVVVGCVVVVLTAKGFTSVRSLRSRLRRAFLR
jgi:hypothetical protein